MHANSKPCLLLNHGGMLLQREKVFQCSSVLLDLLARAQLYSNSLGGTNPIGSGLPAVSLFPGGSTQDICRSSGLAFASPCAVDAGACVGAKARCG